MGLSREVERKEKGKRRRDETICLKMRCIQKGGRAFSLGEGGKYRCFVSVSIEPIRPISLTPNGKSWNP
jgi:hypothetical protein